ncbi:MAG: hypothetical protein IPN91_13925 [Holophagaceae bacterium]|uniref:Uncharacterized protein n=1 Tax=Candidatus Geothrix odensensis TaxID=2954440 RepID=A0A936F3Y9_9BACT|nr:hypothetical protein [Candidatus Geothrix odensensis]
MNPSRAWRRPPNIAKLPRAWRAEPQGAGLPASSSKWPATPAGAWASVASGHGCLPRLAHADAAKKVLQRFGLDRKKLEAATARPQGLEVEDEKAEEKFAAWEEARQDCTALAAAGKFDPVIGRGRGSPQGAAGALRRTKNNPVLIGNRAGRPPS